MAIACPYFDIGRKHTILTNINMATFCTSYVATFHCEIGSNIYNAVFAFYPKTYIANDSMIPTNTDFTFIRTYIKRTITNSRQVQSQFCNSSL